MQFNMGFQKFKILKYIKGYLSNDKSLTYKNMITLTV